MIRILVAEDDFQINRLVSRALLDKGYEVSSAYDGEEALKLFEESSFDLVVSDIMMPKMNGYALAREIRRFNKEIAILFLTALDDKESASKGYLAGIDDYVVKPFDMDLLIMRIDALVRRVNIARTKEISVGNFRMNEEEHTAYLAGEELPLTVREFDLLYKMLSFPKRTFTRSKLMEEFWDYDSSATSRTVDVYMSKLREKTADCDGFKIMTVHGLGYKVVLK